MLTEESYRKAMETGKPIGPDSTEGYKRRLAKQGVESSADYKRRLERHLMDGLGTWKLIEAQVEKLLEKESPTIADLKRAAEFKAWMDTILSLLRKTNG